MAFDIISLGKAAFKRSLGKAHTSNAKDLGNEAVPSYIQTTSQNVFGVAIPLNNPSQAVTDGVALDATSTKFNLVLDPSSGGKAYFITVPSGHPITGYKNPATGVNYVAGDRVQRIIPQSFGDNYRPILYNNTTEIPPLDASDWFIDCAAGIVISEDDLSLGSNGKLGCYIYISAMLDEVISELQTSGSGGSGSEWVTLQYAFNNGQAIDLDGYGNLNINSQDGYGLVVNVQGAISLDSHLDANFHSDGYLTLASDKTLLFTDEFNTNVRFSDPNETYSQTLLTTRKNLVGAINEILLGAGSGGGSTERAVYVLNSTVPMATGLSLASPTYGAIELAPPEGLSFQFHTSVFVYLNGTLLLADSSSYGGSVTNDVALSADGTKLYFAYDLNANDVVQVYNTASEVI